MTNNKMIRVSSATHTFLKWASVHTKKTLPDLFSEAIKTYKETYGNDISTSNVQIQHPLIYPVSVASIFISKADKKYLEKLSTKQSGNFLMIADRVIVNYQNKGFDVMVPDWVRVSWLDEENLNWSNQIPE